jgi:hypothetical protein
MADSTQAQPIGFVAGTLVLAKDGLMPIEKIKVGDHVLSKPENGEGEQAYQRVTCTFEHDDAMVWYVSFLGGTLGTTGGQPFWVRGEFDFEKPNDSSIMEWLPVHELESGMALESIAGNPVLVDFAVPLMRMLNPDWGFIQLDVDGLPTGNIIDFSDGAPKQARGPIGNPPIYPYEAYVYGKVIDRDEVYFNKDEDGEDYPDKGEEASISTLRRKVYGIEVENTHTYYVGERGVWVGDMQR